jgi:hypothetical protein
MDLRRKGGSSRSRQNIRPYAKRVSMKLTGMRTLLIPLLAIHAQSASVIQVSQWLSSISLALCPQATSRSLEPGDAADWNGEPAIHFSSTNQEPEY